MTDLILPTTVRRDNPLAEHLRTRNEAKFRHQVALADVLSTAVSHVAKKRKLRTPDVLDALITSVVSCIQAAVPTEEWSDVGTILADEMCARLAVRQVN